MSDKKNEQTQLGWSSFPISELLAPLDDGRTLHQGWSPRCEKEPSVSETEWGVLKTTSIQPAAFLPEHNKRLPDHLEPRPQIEVKPGDILITCAGPRNRCGIACLVRATRRRLMMSGKMYRFRPDPARVDPRYLEAYLQSADAQAAIDEMKTGGNESGLNLTHDRFRKLLVPVAPLDQQKRIVAEIEKQFSRLDEAVANLKRVKANLKRYKAAVLNEAVSNWPLQALGTLLREPLRNGHSAKVTSNPKGLRAFTLSAVTEGDFSEVNTKRTVADPKRVAGLWAEPGDIYIERSNTPELVGTARLYRGPRNFAFIPDLLIRVRVSDAVVPEYAEIALQSESARHYFRSKAQGIAGTMPKIDQAVIESFPLPLPGLAEQRRIVADVDRRLTIIHGVASAVDANSKRAQTLRQSTLQRCFAGKM